MLYFRRQRCLLRVGWNRYFSSTIRTDIPTRELILDVSNSEIQKKPIEIEINSHWEQYASISSECLQLPEIKVNYEASSKEIGANPDEKMKITTGKTTFSEGKPLKISVPEYIHLSIFGDFLSLSIKSKIYGDLTVSCNDGKVAIEKYKGSSLNINIGKADLTINKVLEGNIAISCGHLSGKILNGNEISAVCDGGVSVDAIYGANTFISCLENLRIGLLKGQLEVDVKNGNTEVSRIDGTFAVVNEKGNVNLQINSLPAQSTSSAVAMNGSVTCVIDPEIKAKIDCEISSNLTDAIAIEAESFHQESAEKHKITGIVTGKSSSGDKAPNGAAGKSGKINILANQQHYQEQQAALTPDLFPSLSITAKSEITVKAAAWLDTIRMKHGLVK